MNIDQPAFPPQNGAVFLTDGGLETTLVFHEGVDLPCFAAFPLLLSESGRQQLERYFEPYLRTARERRVGFILDTPDMARQRGLGRQARVFPAGHRGHQPASRHLGKRPSQATCRGAAPEW